MEELPPSITEQRHTRLALIRATAIIQSIYAAIETIDCITAVLMAFGLINNPYPPMAFKEMQSLFDTQPAWVVPLFLFFTILRITSAIGLWRNRLWGFWMTIFVSAATLIMAPFLLPFTTVEMLGNGLLIITLLIGFFGDTSITPSYTKMM
jgi:uncharacterized membrane protein (DUF2068 family)